MKSINIEYPFFKGRVALHAILRASGIGPGDQVLLPGYTCVVVPNAVIYSGAEPVYLDVDEETFNIDCDKLEDGLNRSWTPDRAKAIIVQHTYGIPCDMEKLTDFARRFNLVIIEDSCHALGSTWMDKEVGTFGDAAFFSCQWSKPITTGLGGWAQINSPELKQKFKALYSEYGPPSLPEATILELQYIAFRLLNRPRLFWKIQNIYRTLGNLGLAIGSSTSGELSCELPNGYKKGMHAIQFRRLKSIISHLDSTIDARRNAGDLVERALKEFGLPTLSISKKCKPVFLRYPVQLNNKDEVLHLAKMSNIQIGDWFLSPIHPNIDNWGLAGYTPGTCPVAEKISRRIINIPTSAGLGKKEIKKTVSFLANNGDWSIK